MLGKIFQAVFKSTGKIKVNGQEYSGTKFTLMIDDKVVQTYTEFPKIDILENVETIDSVNADITAHKLVGEHIKTVNGDVKIEVAGNVSIKTVNGDIKVKSVTGSINT